MDTETNPSELKQPNSSVFYERADSPNSSNSSNDENYEFNAKLCTRLSRELKLPEMQFDDMGTYDIPKEHGLSNNNVIIPRYYNLDKDPRKIFDIDYYVMIKDDIRNYRALNEYQMKYIKELSDECKNEILDMLNECMKIFGEFMLENV